MDRKPLATSYLCFIHIPYINLADPRERPFRFPPDQGESCGTSSALTLHCARVVKSVKWFAVSATPVLVGPSDQGFEWFRKRRMGVSTAPRLFACSVRCRLAGWPAQRAQPMREDPLGHAWWLQRNVSVALHAFGHALSVHPSWIW